MARIAHVISTPVGIGGAERVVEALLEAGAARGSDQYVLNPFAIDPKQAPLQWRLSGATYAGKPCARFRDVLPARSWVAGELARIKPDVVHVHLFHAAALCATLRLSTPALFTHHHVNLLECQNRRAEMRIDRWAGRRYDRVVAVSEWGERYLRERYGYPQDAIARIPNGWTGTPLPRARGAAPPTIVSVGNLRPEKGHERLLASFAGVLEHIPQARLRIVGEGRLRGLLEESAMTLGISTQVEFIGRIDPIWSELSHADVFASAPTAEASGIALLEAMAAGLPTVAFAVGGFPELVQSGLTGKLVPPGDIAALATALIELLSDPDRARDMGKAAAKAAEHLRVESMADSYFDLYEEFA